MTLVSHEEEMIPHPLAATLIWVILFSWAVSWPLCSPPKTSHMWIELSSLEAKIKRPDTEIPEQVNVEAGVGALYSQICWSDRMSHSRIVCTPQAIDVTHLHIFKFEPPPLLDTVEGCSV